jgi:hypothetical protein
VTLQVAEVDSQAPSQWDHLAAEVIQIEVPREPQELLALRVAWEAAELFHSSLPRSDLRRLWRIVLG